MAETLGCVGADLGLPDAPPRAFFLGLLGAEDAAAVAAGTWLVSSDMFFKLRSERNAAAEELQQTGQVSRQTSRTLALRLQQAALNVCSAAPRR